MPDPHPPATGPSFAKELELAIAAAQEAGDIAAEMQSTAVARRKADGSPVSDADEAADEAVRHAIAKRFPGDGLLSEETADDPGRQLKRRLWIIDPIDGTRDYLAGRDEWAVQVALAVDGRVVLGVLAIPAEGLCLAGVVGSGAWRIDDDGRAALSAAPGGSSVLIASDSTRNAGEVAKVRAALPEFAWTASTSVGVKVWRMIAGSADLYVYPKAMAEWDVAAPAALLIAAGGTATDLAGAALRFNSARGVCPGLVCSTRSDHQALIRRMAAGGVAL